VSDSEILVSCIQPGLVKTGLHHRWEIAREGSGGTGYPLEPEDFARMVLFILDQPGMKRRDDDEQAGVEAEVPGAPAKSENAADVKVEAVEEHGWQSVEEEAEAADEGIVQDEI
jgi:hypothetical protein